MIKRYPILLDETADRDILDWLNSLPSRRKAESVRAALRTFMAMQRGETPGVIPMTAPAPKPQRRPKDLEL